MDTLTIPSCSILSRPIYIHLGIEQPSLDKYFKKKEKQTFHSLVELARSNPLQALGKLLHFAQLHKEAPMVLNLLAFCYIQLKDLVAADQVIEEGFFKFPTYLLAQINYADLLLRNNQRGKVPEVFNRNLDLSTFYSPNRTFYVSEVRGFMAMSGHYYHQAGYRKLALEAFRIAVQADPIHPSVLLLEKTLFHQPLVRLIKSLIRKRDSFMLKDSKI